MTDRPAGPDPSLSAARVTAVLGPTNTGKTTLALERMAAHSGGIIGFPLRLLARENYDRLVQQKGRGAVALVTGEEKILPKGARWFVCTVEAMPLDRAFPFLAIDEIQLCADAERGHVFTDRLLHARGLMETMFLGAETIRPILRRLVPQAEILTRQRLSTLTYAGPKKLGKLPPRSAVVAFSASQVYELAEGIRRSRGGTAVVLGALSPRTRNAQVEMYQAGEVDYLVATDAIGMGLNMDIGHVAFARLSKFDGEHPRRLKVTEIAQIAGRAGRAVRDGTFGVTDQAPDLTEEEIEQIETHRFDPLETVRWRNPDLEFATPERLLRSLDRAPWDRCLMRVRRADDQEALEGLIRDPDTRALATSPSRVRLLWDVCGIPDFRKLMSDAHVRLCAGLYRELCGAERLSSDFVARHVEGLERFDGDLDTLIARIAHTRTWTFISHQGHWLEESEHWQDRTRAIEDRLSDALHERLTQRFVDRRSAVLVRSLKDGRDLLAGVRADGAVVVEGHEVGHLTGFQFVPEAGVSGEDAKAIMTAARRTLGEEIRARVARFEAEPDAAFTLAPGARIAWRGEEVATLLPSPALLTPKVRPRRSELLDPQLGTRLRRRLEAWVAAQVADALAPLLRLREAPLAGAARGIAFQLVEGLGCLPRAPLEGLIGQLTGEDRAALKRLGVRLGSGFVHVAALARPKPVAWRSLLWSVHHDLPEPPVPPPGRGSVPAGLGTALAGAPEGWFLAIGYPRAGSLAVRVDLLDRVAGGLHEAARAEAGGRRIALRDAGLANLLGCTLEQLDGVAAALGFRRFDLKGDAGPLPAYRQLRRPRPTPTAPRQAEPPADSAHPFAKLAGLGRA